MYCRMEKFCPINTCTVISNKNYKGNSFIYFLKNMAYFFCPGFNPADSHCKISMSLIFDQSRRTSWIACMMTWSYGLEDQTSKNQREWNSNIKNTKYNQHVSKKLTVLLNVCTCEHKCRTKQQFKKAELQTGHFVWMSRPFASLRSSTEYPWVSKVWSPENWAKNSLWSQDRAET